MLSLAQPAPLWAREAEAREGQWDPGLGSRVLPFRTLKSGRAGVGPAEPSYSRCWAHSQTGPPCPLVQQG